MDKNYTNHIGHHLTFEFDGGIHKAKLLAVSAAFPNDEVWVEFANFPKRIPIECIKDCSCNINDLKD